MNKMLIVAGYELRSAVMTRGFWIQMLAVPLMIAAMAVIPRLIERQQPPTVYVVIDQAGDVAQPLMDLLDRPPAGAPATTALRVPVMRDFDIPQEPAALAAALTPYLKGAIKVASDQGPQSLSAAVVIPAGFGTSTGASVQILSVRPAPNSFVQQMRGALTQILRARALEARGVDPQVVAQIQGIFAPLTTVNPEQQGRPRNQQSDFAKLIGPLGMSVLLLMSAFTAGARLLSSTLEERSNKLVETLLSSVTADQLMIGKLAGNAIVGLVVVLAWVGSGVAMLQSTDASNEIVALISTMLDAKTITAFILYFLAAYVMYAAMFLGIGSVADSAQDAQAYMMPVMLMMFLPMAMLAPISNAPNGTLAVVMSWIPICTPITMMVRLSADPPLWQVVGTSIVMLAFLAVLLLLLARLFRISVLASGATIRPAQVWRILTQRSS